MHGIRLGQVYVSDDVTNMWGIVTKIEAKGKGVTSVTLYHPIARWYFHSFIHFMEQGSYYRSPTREAMIDKGELDDWKPGDPVIHKLHVLAHQDKPSPNVDGNRPRRSEAVNVQQGERRGRTRKQIKLDRLRLQRSAER